MINPGCLRNLLLLALCLPASAARGQTQLTFTTLEIDEASGSGRKLSDTELKDYFNSARCGCNNPLRVRVKFSWPQGAKPSGSVRIVSGPTSCLTTEKKIDTADCRVHYAELIQKLAATQTFIDAQIPAADLMLRPGKDCASSAEQTSFNLYVFTDSAENERFEPASGVNRQYAVDTTPPDPPKPGKQPEGGEGMITVYFDKPDSGEQNLKYQVLCQKTEAPDDKPRAASESPAYDLPGTIQSCDAEGAPAAADGGVADGMTTFQAADGGSGDAAPADAAPSDGPAPDAGVADLAPIDLGDADQRATAADAAPVPAGIRAAKYVCSGSTSSAGSLTIKGLQDGMSYRFYVVSIDDVRNPSEPIELGSGTPARDEDLWERYKRSGGTASGGCAFGGGPGWRAALAPALLGGLLLLAGARHARRRRARAHHGRAGRSLLALALVSWPVAASATGEAASAQQDYSSPQHFAAEIKLGPYAPNIDSEFAGGGPGPFARLFGDGQALMVRGELDFQIWRGFGSIGVGVAGGYYGNSANALLDDSAGSSPSTSETRSAGKTSITLVPLAVLAVYRFDVLADRYSIPLVPFVKLGLGYTLWWIDKSDGALASVDGDDAIGGSLGLVFNAGLALRLDMIEPTASKNLDNDIGINHTYLFFEFCYDQANGFGSQSKLDVGDTTWQAGLAFEF